MQLLVENGAKLGVRDRFGRRPVDAAKTEEIRLLLSEMMVMGADEDMPSK